jgi:large conductance mechanosensitive channel
MDVKSKVKGFQAFLMRGNVLDLAVGVIIGGAFGKIVSSFVNDILMPPIGLLLGNVNFSSLAITLKEAKDGSEAVLWKYGSFIQNVIDFLIIGLCDYLLITLLSSLKPKKKEEAPAPLPPTKTEELLAEIRDLLKDK